MAEKTKVKSKSKGDDKVVKKSKSKEEKQSSKSSKKLDKQASANGSALTLLASDKTLNADLSSLFAVKVGTYVAVFLSRVWSLTIINHSNRQ